MKIEMTISEEVPTLEEFLNSIERKNSKFTVWQKSSELATIHFNAIGYGSIIYLVRGKVDQSVLNTLNPTIKLEGSLAYRISQLIIIVFFIFMLTSLFRDFQLVPAGIIILGCLAFLGFLYFLYKIAEGIFEGNFYDEINSGKRKTINPIIQE